MVGQKCLPFWKSISEKVKLFEGRNSGVKNVYNDCQTNRGGRVCQRKSDWFEVRQAYVTYDHPFKAPFEHALNIDLVNEAQGPAARISAELGPQAARALAEAILAVLAQAETGDTWYAPRMWCRKNKFRSNISPNSVQKGDLAWRAHLQVS